MRIGIDISQLAYQNTGVANYLENLVKATIEEDHKNEYILFFSSLRRFLPQEIEDSFAKYENVKLKKFRLPPSALDFIWNKTHRLSIEKLIGKVDLFISSDWAEPPVKSAKKATIIYDLVSLLYPNETAQKIVSAQTEKLKWVKKECDIIFCISESTKKDIIENLNIEEKKIRVIYPGL